MSIKQLKRIFKFDQISLDDFNPLATPMEIKDFYSHVYPELTVSSSDGPIIINEDTVQYNFKKTIGVKG